MPKLDPKVKKCAEFLLKSGATDVYLFGSRARGVSSEDSDYDFAVKGLDPSSYFRVLGALQRLAQAEVDLVLLDDGSPFALHVTEKIEKGWAVHV